MWHYYLCYCEAGFEERVIGDVQLHMQKPLCRAVPAVEQTPAPAIAPR